MTQNARYEGGEGSIQRTIALGTGAVATGTHVLGVVPKKCIPVAVRFYGQGAVVATSLTGQVYARTLAGAAGESIQSEARDIKFASAAAAKAGVAGSLATARDGTHLSENQLLEVVITGDTCSQGPGDLVVVVDYKPRV